MVNVDITSLCPGRAVVRRLPCARGGSTGIVGHNVGSISLQDEFSIKRISIVLVITRIVLTECCKCPRRSASEGKDLCRKCRCW